MAEHFVNVRSEDGTIHQDPSVPPDTASQEVFYQYQEALSWPFREVLRLWQNFETRGPAKFAGGSL